MKNSSFSIYNLRQNNLSIPEIKIPLHHFVLVQGQSGSGKSSFAIDTLLREGQRRLLSALRLPSSDIPLVQADFLDPLPTTLGMEQDADLRLGRFETLGTYTAIHDQLAHLFIRYGVTHCSSTNKPIPTTPPEIVVQQLLVNHSGERISFLSPLNPCTPQNYTQTIKELQRSGFARIAIGNKIQNIEEAPPHPPKKWSLVIDRIKIEERHKDRMFQAIQQAYRGVHKRCGIFFYSEAQTRWFYQKPYSEEEKRFLPTPSLPLLRFRSSIGACQYCKGTGLHENDRCRHCGGTRLHEHNQHILWNNKTIIDLLSYSLLDLHNWLMQIENDIAIDQICKKTQVLLDLKLHNLSLHRSFDSLSTGEKSKLRLFRLLVLEIKQALFVLDEPSLGLAQEDIKEIIPLLLRLKEDNTLIVVDHSPIFSQYADRILYFGPKAGKEGGRILTKIPTYSSPPLFSDRSSPKKLTIPIQNQFFSIPTSGFHVLSGRSASGKTTLLSNIYRYIQENTPDPFHTTKMFTGTLSGSTRSCTATLTGLWSNIRQLLSETKESRTQGYSNSQFSFNVSGGRCEACKGMGAIRIHIPPLPMQEQTCSLCLGTRFDAATLLVEYKGYNAAQLLMLEIREAREIFTHHPKIYVLLDTLCAVGLGYLPLGQVSNTLSGGERRRLLMAKTLAGARSSRTDMNGTLFLLDEPSAALHPQDCTHILTLIEQLRAQGATVICASNHPWFIERADVHTPLPLANLNLRGS